MSGALQAVYQNLRSFGAAPGSQSYTVDGTYSWVAPAGVTSVSVVAFCNPGWFYYSCHSIFYYIYIQCGYNN